MSVVVERDRLRVSYVNGAPEALVPRLARADSTLELRADEWSQQGIRVRSSPSATQSGRVTIPSAGYSRSASSGSPTRRARARLQPWRRQVKAESGR